MKLFWTGTKSSKTGTHEQYCTPIHEATFPSNEREAKIVPDSGDWKDTMVKELRDQLKTKAPLPVKKTKEIRRNQIVPVSWVFTLKKDINHQNILRKARMPLFGTVIYKANPHLMRPLRLS